MVFIYSVPTPSLVVESQLDDHGKVSTSENLMSKRYLTRESKFNCDDDAVQRDAAILQSDSCTPSVSSPRGCSQKKEIKSEAINPSSFLLQRELGPVCSPELVESLHQLDFVFH